MARCALYKLRIHSSARITTAVLRLVNPLRMGNLIDGLGGTSLSPSELSAMNITTAVLWTTAERGSTAVGWFGDCCFNMF